MTQLTSGKKKMSMARLLSGERQGNSCSKTRYCLLATPCSYRQYIDNKVQCWAAVDSKENFFLGHSVRKIIQQSLKKARLERYIPTRLGRTDGWTDGLTNIVHRKETDRGENVVFKSQKN